LAIPNPQHLLEQADRLRGAGQFAKPRQVDLRRAISSAYYAVFHHVLITCADEFVGRSLRGEPRYSLVYRHIEHRSIKRVCDEVSRQSLSSKYGRFMSSRRFDPRIREFANGFIRLHEMRHEADYDPEQYFSAVDAMFGIYLASHAIGSLSTASMEDRRLFLTLLVFPPR
jgi:hypothetical protein